MSNLTNPQLIQFIVCPACGGDLAEEMECLRCSHCSTQYEIRKGIPLLFPPGMNLDHLKGEEELAKMIKSPRLSSKAQFSSSQWTLSKLEFWSMVEDHIKPPPGLFINIGCGYNKRFSQFEQLGHTFINFDIIFDMLLTLQSESGAKSCVAGDVNRLPFRKGIFDYVVCIDLIHHESKNLLPLLRSFRELLKPGGTLFLEDPNAWGMFQMAKSIFLPRFLYGFLRSTYHRFKQSTHRPADYEFATNVWQVKAILDKLGFQEIEVYPNEAYPCISETSYRLYRLLSRFNHVREYHNYHYRVSATKL